MAEMEVQGRPASEASSQAASEDRSPAERGRVAPAKSVLALLGTPSQKKVPFLLVVVVVLLMGSIILGCLMFIEQQSKEQALLTPSPTAPPTSQEELTDLQEAAPVPRPHRTTRARPHEAAEVKTSPLARALPAELHINTQPPGAQIQLDDRSSGDWVTPYIAEQLDPGKHTIILSKTGYRVESRTVEVQPGRRLSFTVALTELPAVVSISSQPAEAGVLVDGADTGHVTPAQLSLGKGPHAFTLRKPGFFDATREADLRPGQNVQLALVLKEIRADLPVQRVKKLRKIYGKPPAGMGWVQIRTVPKGAQISINRRPLESPAPADFLLEIGDYEVTLAFTGYKTVQKVIHVGDGARIEIDEVLERSY